MSGLRKQSLPNLAQKRAIDISSVMVAVRKVNFRQLIGFHTLRRVLGPTNQPWVENIISGTCTGLHQNNLTSIGITRKSRKTFLRLLSSGQIAALMHSELMWLMPSRRIYLSHCATLMSLKGWNSAVVKAKESWPIAMSSLRFIKNGANSLIPMIPHALLLLKPLSIQNVYRSMPAQRL